MFAPIPPFHAEVSQGNQPAGFAVRSSLGATPRVYVATDMQKQCSYSPESLLSKRDFNQHFVDFSEVLTNIASGNADQTRVVVEHAGILGVLTLRKPHRESVGIHQKFTFDSDTALGHDIDID